MVGCALTQSTLLQSGFAYVCRMSDRQLVQLRLRVDEGDELSLARDPDHGESLLVVLVDVVHDVERFLNPIAKGSGIELICNVDMPATVAALTGQNLEKSQLADSVNVLPAVR